MSNKRVEAPLEKLHESVAHIVFYLSTSLKMVWKNSFKELFLFLNYT